MARKQDCNKQPKINRRKAALALLDEMIADCAVMLCQDARRLYKPRLQVLRDAIARKIV